MSSAEIWDNEARTDPRYATRAWGGDGTPEAVEPTIDKILVNLKHAYELRQSYIGGTTRSGLEICEFGCGPGRLLHRFAALHPWDQFYGVDISLEMINLARQVSTQNVVGYIHHDIGAPNDGVLINEQRFDLIYSIEVFQHLHHDSKLAALHLMWKMLVPGGLALVQFTDHPRGHAPLDHPLASYIMEAQAGHVGFEVLSPYPGPFDQIEADWRWLGLVKPSLFNAPWPDHTGVTYT